MTPPLFFSALHGHKCAGVYVDTETVRGSRYNGFYADRVYASLALSLLCRVTALLTATVQLDFSTLCARLSRLADLFFLIQRSPTTEEKHCRQ